MTATTTTIRVSTETHQRLATLAETLDVPLAEATARAAKLLVDHVFWEQTHAAYAAMRADPVASAEFDAEHELWSSLPDGLENA